MHIDLGEYSFCLMVANIRYLWKQSFVIIPDRKFFLFIVHNYMMMSIVFLVWWLFARAAIETGFFYT